MPTRDELVTYLDELLDINGVSDHSMNGLQVQGAKQVTKVGLATDAALATYQKAADAKCEMLLVHHGIIWGGLKYITGRNYDHLSYLIRNDLNLYAAHLPLDMHPEVGNNALLAKEAGLVQVEPFGAYHGSTIGYRGRFEPPLTLDACEKLWAEKLELLKKRCQCQAVTRW